MEQNMEKEKLEAELRELRSSLQANTSDIGDWKIVKAMEYQMNGKEIPYNMEELNNTRQSVRNRINEIETLLEKYE